MIMPYEEVLRILEQKSWDLSYFVLYLNSIRIFQVEIVGEIACYSNHVSAFKKESFEKVHASVIACV